MVSETGTLKRYLLIKRGLDFAGALLALVLLFPLLTAISFFVLVADGRPVIFCQQRPGLDGKPFSLLKFRSMDPNSDNSRDGKDESSRVTKLGGLLRKTSLDELPSLWNVLVGEMSFVGPRPLLAEYEPIYSPRHRQRNQARPGITGLAQVSGRNLLSWEERLDLDILYLRERTLRLDFAILIRSISAVTMARGVVTADGETMAKLAPGYDSKLKED